MTFPFPVLWSGGCVFTEDSPAEANAVGDAYWHAGGGTPPPDYYPYTLDDIDALIADWGADVVCYWPLSETPGGTGSGVYEDVVGGLDMNAVTSVNAQGDIDTLYDTGKGVEFGSGEVSVTNDGTIDWTATWGVVLCYKPDTVSSDRVLFEVSGTDGFTISVMSDGKVRWTNTDTSEYFETEDACIEAGQTHVIEVDQYNYSGSYFVGYITVDGVVQTIPGGGGYPFTPGQTNDTKIEIGGGADGTIGWVVVGNASAGDDLDWRGESGELHDLVTASPDVYDEPGVYTDDLDLTQTGRPTLQVAVDSRLVLNELQQANWRMGHKGWLSDLEPGNADLTFIGLMDGQPGDDVVIYCETGPLWAGAVDDVNSTRGRDMVWYTSIAGVDVLGRIGKTELLEYVTSLSGEQEAQDLIADALVRHGQQAEWSEAFAAGEGRTEYEDYAYSGDLIGYINRQATIGNLWVGQDRLGNLRYVSRGPMASSPRAIALVGIDSPGEWMERQSSADVVNTWYAENQEGTVLLDEAVAESQGIFGIKTFEFDAPESWTGYDDGAYAGGMTTAMADPRTVLDDGAFLITSLAQSALFVEPLDLVQHFQDLWVVHEVRHEVTPWEWRVHLAGERDNDTLNGLDAADDPAPENPTEATIDVQTIDSNYDALILRESDGTKKGAGAGNYLPVGRDSNGDKYRALIEFSITWPTGFVRVQKATLRLQNSDQSILTRGQKPRVEVRSVTRDWTEGTETNPATGNAVVWGDTLSRDAGSTVRRLGNRTDDAYVYLDVTDIAQAWYDSGVNHGVMLKAANEHRTRNATEFYSSDSSESGPRLILRCVTE